MPAAEQTSLVALSDIRGAAAVLAGVAVRTPLLPAEELSVAVGVPVWLKPETLQRGGAFKFRGAYTYLAALDPVERARGVIAPSSGNHAQAVALAARLFGVPATVVMPTTVTPAKRGGAERLGARVVLAVRIGAVPFAHHQAYLDEVVLVEDDALRGAMRFLLDRMKLVAEPSGAIAVAALLEGVVRPAGASVALLSGGDVE